MNTILKALSLQNVTLKNVKISQTSFILSMNDILYYPQILQ